MEFSPAFYLLTKFSIGLRDYPKSEDDVVAVAAYLGLGFSDVALEDKIKLLAEELQTQNGFLSTELSSETISQSPEYQRSMFVREVVANNRKNIQNSTAT
ncbi:hypothetical protein [Beijerinckia sp. L45]|uniref:hypothetical protein n=1 Tax=Beijerinckia sp. L45 TaxID=1641855 RepID=UPI00131D1530|nr:hypothetical protein [Beijerinckia sp. L45]